MRKSLITLLSVAMIGCGTKEDSGEGSICATDYDCAGDLVCEQNRCVSSGSSSGVSPSGNVPDYKNGAAIHKEKTSNGIVTFVDQQTKEDVVISVTDQQGKGLEDVIVTFIDGKGFEAFTVEKKGFISQVDVFAHNSGHDFRLVSASAQDFTVFDVYFGNNPEKKTAFDSYVAWAKNAYAYRGCMTREELEKGRKDTLAIVASAFSGQPGLAGLYRVVATAYERILKLQEWSLLGDLEEVYDVYEPLDFTAPPLFQGKQNQKECKETVCTPHATTVCSDNAVYWRDSCGDLEEKTQDCSATQYCTAGKCVPKEPDCISHNDISCYTDGDVHWFDSCGNPEEIVKDCTAEQYCEEGQCIDKAPPCDSAACIYVTNSLYASCGEGCAKVLNSSWYDVCLQSCESNVDCNTYAGFSCKSVPQQTIPKETKMCLLESCDTDANCPPLFSCVSAQDIAEAGATMTAKFSGGKVCYRNECMGKEN